MEGNGFSWWVLHPTLAISGQMALKLASIVSDPKHIHPIIVLIHTSTHGHHSVCFLSNGALC
jgi:hypothetical protein